MLWASTSTKNPAYSDIYYVEELIGPDTVDTIPPATYDAFRDHGKPRDSLEENVEAAHQTMEGLEKAGISMKEATDKLTEDGVKLFADAFDNLARGRGATHQRGIGGEEIMNTLTYKLPDEFRQGRRR